MRHAGYERVDLIYRYFSRRDVSRLVVIYNALSKNYQLGRLKPGVVWDDQALEGIAANLG